MRCRDVTGRLEGYMSGALPAAVQAEVASHLRACETCRQALVFDRRFVALVAGLQTPAIPEDFAERVMARARRSADTDGAARRPWRWYRSSSRWMRIAAAVVLAAGLVLGGLLGRRAAPTSGQRPSVRAAARMDELAQYNLDVLNDVPEGSLADTYLALLADSSAPRH